MSTSKNKKVETAVVVAIIGLIGTILVGLLNSPILLKMLESTPIPATATATATSATTSAPATETTSAPPSQELQQIFKADFEDGTASGFGFDLGDWKVVKDKSNHILQGTASAPIAPAAIAYFGPNDFSDGVIEFRVKFPLLTSNMYFDYRLGEGKGSYVLYAVPGDQTIVLATNILVNQDWQFSAIGSDTTQPFTFLKDTWYTVRLEVKGEKMVVSIDGNRILSASDSRLARGRIRFALDPNSVVDFDDVSIWTYR